MIRPPPRSTRTDTLFPYTTLFRSHRGQDQQPIVPAHTGLALAAREGQEADAAEQPDHQVVIRRADQPESAESEVEYLVDRDQKPGRGQNESDPEGREIGRASCRERV